MKKLNYTLNERKLKNQLNRKSATFISKKEI